MASAIDATQPPATNPTTAGVRAQFATAKSEITALQAADVVLQGRATALENRATAVEGRCTVLESKGFPVLSETLDASVAAGDTVVVTHPSVPWPGTGGFPGGITFSAVAENVAADKPDEIPATWTQQNLNEAGATWVQDALNTGHFSVRPHPTFDLLSCLLGAGGENLITYGMADPTVAGSCETNALVAGGVHAINAFVGGAGQVFNDNGVGFGGAFCWAYSDELIGVADIPDVGRLTIEACCNADAFSLGPPRLAVSLDGGTTWLQWVGDITMDWEVVTLAGMLTGHGMQVVQNAAAQPVLDQDGDAIPDSAWIMLADYIRTTATSVMVAVSMGADGGSELVEKVAIVWAEATQLEPCTCGRTGEAVDFEVHRSRVDLTHTSFTRPGAVATLTGVRCQVWTWTF
jgi:hypothetical protein